MVVRLELPAARAVLSKSVAKIQWLQRTLLESSFTTYRYARYLQYRCKHVTNVEEWYAVLAVGIYFGVFDTSLRHSTD